ncbi:MAG TPA: hypothetical protein ENN80_11260 [Candidatus Hydrogenedentes bacterium]|nr:hypothetical protein [Candidatus Hydrogenedentota bacterium]
MRRDTRKSDRTLEDIGTAIEADAVCAQCGMINPEGTLLCKSCGNNLREQRQRRLTTAQPTSASVTESPQAAWLKKALAVLGVLVVIWVLINATRIENFLVTVQVPDASGAEELWKGEERVVYERLLRELDMNPVTEEEINVALKEAPAAGTYDGRYVLVRDGTSSESTRLGAAYAKQHGDKVFFVARLPYDVEIRGKASPVEGGRLEAQDSAGVYIEGGYYIAGGYAERREGNGFTCRGESDYDTLAMFEALAYPVPKLDQFEF